ncbi:radical SAM/SPASM domain-containing protein [Francisella frigiditurris]|uniref:Radical SAM additional 4Fe4S-binding SPASM domain protein n=1 Tax=Francisella frigiditurris TaxID=1542390 RepID=A0A1J0KSE9_9GAMM|nr:radical SAM protein [Francisella frigiditurris]APC96611.1 radical SAM additional 4Fe4S-binding SPASM domain protein [Francisella frigiditurris]
MKFEPKWIAWETTRECNLECMHCRSNACLGSYKHLDFSTEEGFDVINKIAEFSQPCLVLSGGEPLLREDIFELANYGTRKGLRMALATNGTLVTNKICERIKESGIRIVSLSLDGSCEETHDTFRKQKGAFAATLRATELFRNHNIPFIVNSSFTKHNHDEIKETYQLAKEIGATSWYMFMVVPTGRGQQLMDELLHDEKYDEALDWHYNMESDEEEMLVRPTCAPHYYRIRFEKNKDQGKTTKSRSLSFSTGGSKGCIAGQSIMTIDVEGNVNPCSYLPLKAGNIFKQDLAEIWNESGVFNNLRNFKEYKGKCGACEYIKICGGCRARAHYINNDYMAEEPLCNYIPKRLKAV